MSAETYQVKIYKIVNSINDEIYIGSTRNELRVRWQQHKKVYKINPKQNGLYELMTEYGYDVCRIILVETIEVESREHQLREEQRFIDEMKPLLNKYNAFGQTCEHMRQRNGCKECGSSSICEHMRQRNLCKECKGSAICEHMRQRNLCKECKGSAICEHNSVRNYCKECKGSAICEHNSVRNYCKECKGSAICKHNRQRYACVECSPLHCKYCNTTMPKSYWNQHIKTKKHQNNSPPEN